MDHFLIDADQFKMLRVHIIDEPDRIVDPCQGLDHRSAHGLIGFRLLMPVRNIRNKHVIQPFVFNGVHVMAVIVNPAHLAVLSDDPVFHIIEIRLVLMDLFVDRS